MSNPPTKGPYTPAIRCGNLLFCSGQIGVDLGSGKLVEGGTLAQLRQALANLDSLLKTEGLGADRVVKTTVFLVDMAEFAAVNEGYASYFQASPRPARSCVAVTALPLGARVEIEAIARLP